jgi:glycosyltransferase involved in cell wall biosynthesis
MLNPKISLITVTYNSSKTISTCISSVMSQTYQNIEHIIIDGASKDSTIEIIKSLPNRISKIVSEPDDGIYQAMNKGIRHATGDIVGVLNSDDFFCSNNVIETLVKSFDNENVDAIYGDIQFINPNNINKIVRYYSSKKFNLKKFKFGYMPAHPSFYVRRKYFDLLGYYKEDYKIAADFELVCRYLFVNKLKSSYVEMPFVSMRPGGVSTKSIKSNIILNNEIVRACKENGIETNLIYIYFKYFIKIFELF